MKKLTKEEFVVRAVEIHDDRYNYDKVEYVNNATKVKIWCNRCEEYFEVTPKEHLNGQKCYYCLDTDNYKNRNAELTELEVIESIKLFYDKFDRHPKIEDFGICGLHSYKTVRTAFPILTLRGIFKKCGLPEIEYTPSNKILKDDGLKILADYCKSIGRIPTIEEYSESIKSPEISWYSSNFGTFTEALRLLGFKILSEQEKYDNAIIKFRELASELGRHPFPSELRSVIDNNQETCCFSIFLNNKKYRDICCEYLPEFLLRNHGIFTLDDVVDNLHNCIEQIGHIPSYEEYKKYSIEFNKGDCVNLTIILRNFNMTFLDLLEFAGYNSDNTTTAKIDTEIALDQFKSLCLKLNRIPTHDEINDSDIPTSTSYIKYFGSIDNVVSKLDIQHLKLKDSHFGRLSYDKNGQRCRSITEEKISNFLIENNVIFKKETSYSELIEGDKRRFDWKIYSGDKIYYAEYFGMYDQQRDHKVYIAYKKKADSKMSDLREHGHSDNCIFIFPKDIYNLNEVFKSIIKPQINTCTYSKFAI
jgi:hypothetical protein